MTNFYETCFIIRPEDRSILRRFIVTLWLLPSYFLSAGLWELFSLYALLERNFRYDDPRYFLLTGLGSLFGIIIARFLVIYILRLDKYTRIFELHSALQSSICSGVATGSLWQYSMNLSKHYHLSFNLTVAFVFSMSTICYFLTTLIIRIANIKAPLCCQLRFRVLSLNVIYNDFLESLTVGIAGK